MESNNNIAAQHTSLFRTAVQREQELSSIISQVDPGTGPSSPTTESLRRRIHAAIL